MTKWTKLGARTICAAALLSLASPADAQSTWGSDDTETAPPTPRRQQTRVFDEASMRGYDEFTGPYAQFGVTIGVIDYDGSIDVDAGGGVSITGGYRILPWLSGEANVTYVGGGDAEVGNNNVGDAEFFAFTFGPKFYPMAAVKNDVLPEFLQPYGLVAIGGGEFELDLNGGGDNEKSSFIARFIFGMDLWITDHFGTYMEGGYHAAADDDIDGAGVFTFGGQYRF
jgi:hypothetical protein